MEGAEDNRPDPRRGQADELLIAQRARAVRHVVDGLSEKDRLLLNRIYFEEKDKDEICREFKIDRGYLRVLLHRAIHRCRALLEAEEKNSRGRL